MRARVDVSEIEARTKIRAKYLRALENEEWDLLPGPTFVRSFLRTYAHALGLDGKALVEEYRLRCEPPSEAELQPVIAGARRSRGRTSPGGSAPSRGYVLATAGVIGLIILLLVGLLTGKSGAPPAKVDKAHKHIAGRTTGSAHTSSSATRGASDARRVALSFQPSAPVYVCLIAGKGRKVIPGVIIQPPYTPTTYHAAHFDLTLGNNAVTMYVDGKAVTIPASSRAIGYSISKSGRRLLEPGEMPTCQ